MAHAALSFGQHSPEFIGTRQMGKSFLILHAKLRNWSPGCEKKVTRSCGIAAGLSVTLLPGSARRWLQRGGRGLWHADPVFLDGSFPANIAAVGGNTQLSDPCLPFMFLKGDSFALHPSRSRCREAKRHRHSGPAENLIGRTVRHTQQLGVFSSGVPDGRTLNSTLGFNNSSQ